MPWLRARVCWLRDWRSGPGSQSLAGSWSSQRRILTKLGRRDRVQAVVLAYETGLAAANSPAAWRP